MRRLTPLFSHVKVRFPARCPLVPRSAAGPRSARSAAPPRRQGAGGQRGRRSRESGRWWPCGCGGAGCGAERGAQIGKRGLAAGPGALRPRGRHRGAPGVGISWGPGTPRAGGGCAQCVGGHAFPCGGWRCVNLCEGSLGSPDVAARFGLI